MTSGPPLAASILAAGCFWCSEAIFSDIRGVVSVKPGYIGGQLESPTYEQVCTGDTGHAEAIRIVYDPALIAYETLLDIFFHAHDPTTLNRQGDDVGTQYRSAIFPIGATEEQVARLALDRAQALWSDPVVTSIEPGDQPWFEAETYHQDYFARNGTTNGYCSMVVAPKIKAFREKYRSRLKSCAPEMI